MVTNVNPDAQMIERKSIVFFMSVSSPAFSFAIHYLPGLYLLAMISERFRLLRGVRPYKLSFVRLSQVSEDFLERAISSTRATLGRSSPVKQLIRASLTESNNGTADSVAPSETEMGSGLVMILSHVHLQVSCNCWLIPLDNRRNPPENRL
jgi:hypothetical protein